jgi:hypothetical protein
MIETAVVVDKDGESIHWHLPPGRSSVSIPDTKDLWDVLWDNRGNLSGVAHSHPGGGIPSPSIEDLTTFAPCEAALGQRLVWWIISENYVVSFVWKGPSEYDYEGSLLTDTEVEGLTWVDELRKLSYGGQNG